MSEIRVGVIAEDETDCDAIAILVRRIRESARATRLGVKKRPAQGCAKLVRKTRSWLSELFASGCAVAIVVHDLDRDPANGELRDERTLNAQLHQIPVPAGMSRLICIPVEELEAWFFSSEAALRHIGGPSAKPHPSPHNIRRPKERLMAMSRDAGKKARYSTNDNPRLAELLELDACASRCRAFAELRSFVEKLP